MEESGKKKRKGMLVDDRGKKKRAKGEEKDGEKLINRKSTAEERMEGEKKEGEKLMEESGKKKRKRILVGDRGKKKRAKGEEKEGEKLITLKFTAEETMEGVEYITHGSWNKSNHSNYRLSVESSRIQFISFREARRTARLLNSLEHPSIPRLLALDDCGGVIVGRLPHIFLPTWLEEGAGSTLMWKKKLSTDKKYFLEMEPTTQKIFRGITKGLRYLHNNDKYHGNLLNGVFVSTADEVKVVFANFEGSLEFQDGLAKDINDLCTLVNLAVEYHSKGIEVDEKFPKTPPTLKSFHMFHQRFTKCGNFEEKRKLAKFMYGAPLFWNWMDRRLFLSKMENFKKGSSLDFNRQFQFDQKARLRTPNLQMGQALVAMPRLVGWQQLAKSLPEESPLRGIYDKNESGKLFQNSGGIYWFHILCLKHYRETREVRARKQKLKVTNSTDDSAALDELLEVYPKAITVFYEKMAFALCPISLPTFRRDLIEFFEEEPEPLL